MKKPPKSMMGIESPTASHLPVLEQATRDASLVIEHGAGLYSTALLARLGCRVVCAEPHDGWREWARWMYQDRAEVVDSHKRIVPHLEHADVAFIDGPSRERGVIVQWCLDRRVPCIIAHDTNEKDWHEYGYQPHMFTAVGYDVSHSTEDTHRTTLWRLRS